MGDRHLVYGLPAVGRQAELDDGDDAGTVSGWESAGGSFPGGSASRSQVKGPQGGQCVSPTHRTSFPAWSPSLAQPGERGLSPQNNMPRCVGSRWLSSHMEGPGALTGPQGPH